MLQTRYNNTLKEGGNIMFPRTLALTLGAVLFLSVLIQPVLGAEYPTRTIEIFCGFTPGGSIDLAARVVGEVAKKYIGQPMVIVNKPGAGGSLAALEVVNAKPDGYKLFTNSTLYFAVTSKTQKTMFDPSVLVPLAGYMEYTDGIVVRGDSPWKTLPELIDYGKKNPRKIRWGHVGRGTKPYLCGILIFRKGGVEAIDIPYKGSADTITAILGGHVDVAFAPFLPSLEHFKTGKLRPLMNFSDNRYTTLPQIPSAVELGYQELGKMIPIASVFAHKDTPEEIKKILIDCFKKVGQDPEYRKGLEQIGEQCRPEGPEFVKEIIKSAEQVSVPLLKEFGLYVER
jgi:tripartite-type tricarboxylate transporter receptor subunit TctC